MCLGEGQKQEGQHDEVTATATFFMPTVFAPTMATPPASNNILEDLLGNLETGVAAVTPLVNDLTPASKKKTLKRLNEVQIKITKVIKPNSSVS